MQLYLLVMLGGAMGSAARYWCSGLVANLFGQTFPWGTLFVNVLGSLIIGLFNTLTGPDGKLLVGTDARQFVMVGFCGGYTTFSSFSLQTLNLMRDGEFGWAGANVALSVLVCMVSVWIGHTVAMAINQIDGL